MSVHGITLTALAVKGDAMDASPVTSMYITQHGVFDSATR